MNYIKYIDEYPSVPEYLLESIESIINKPRKISKVKYDFFQTREISPELNDWLKSVFDFEFYPQYQIIYEGLPIHKDLGRDIALNYILVTGGDNITTSVYDDNRQLLQQEILEPKRWHSILTNHFHYVSGLSADIPRVALSLHPNWSIG